MRSGYRLINVSYGNTPVFVCENRRANKQRVATLSNIFQVIPFIWKNKLINKHWYLSKVCNLCHDLQDSNEMGSHHQFLFSLSLFSLFSSLCHSHSLYLPKLNSREWSQCNVIIATVTEDKNAEMENNEQPFAQEKFGKRAAQWIYGGVWELFGGVCFRYVKLCVSWGRTINDIKAHNF